MNAQKPSTTVRPSTFVQAAAGVTKTSTRAGLPVRSGLRAGYSIDGESTKKDHNKGWF